MLTDAKIRYTILLACLVIGPIVILVGVTNRWLWFRPIPDLSQRLIISAPAYRDRAEFYYASTDGSVAYFNADDIPADQPVVMVYFRPTRPRSIADPPYIVWQDESIMVWPDWRVSIRGENPEWIFTVSENCIVVDDGEIRQFSSADADLITSDAELQVTISQDPTSQANTGTITAVYLDPSPGGILGRRGMAFRYIIVGFIMTAIGGFYFYGPRRGWLRWREGLTMPDDAPFWES